MQTENCLLVRKWLLFFQENRLHATCLPRMSNSIRETICMECQVIFSPKEATCMKCQGFYFPQKISFDISCKLSPRGQVVLTVKASLILRR